MFHGGLRGLARTPEKARNRRQAARRLFAYLWPHRLTLLLVTIATVGASLTPLAAPYLVGRAIDQFIARGDRHGLAVTMGMLAGTILAGYVFNALSNYTMAVVAQRTLQRLRDDIFEQIQRLSIRYFDTHDAGDLMSRLVNDTDTINQFLSNGLNRTVINSLSLVGIIVVMLRMQTRLALVSFSVIPFMVVTTLYFARRARVAFRRTRERIGAVSAELEENISGVREVQAFAREQANLRRFYELNAANRDANIYARTITAAFTPAVDLLSAIAMAIVAGYGGYLAVQGQASVGLIVAFLGYVQRFFMPIRSISQLYTTMQSALAGAERIFHLLDERPEIQDAPDAIEMPPIRGHVVFDHVYFGYKPGEEVLHDICLEARPGQTLALVGPTGAGKTSIVNLLMRFYDVWDGAVLIDGMDVRRVRQASMRRQMGIVLQDTFLFSGTVADNIRYGRLDATDEEVEAAARLVNAHDFISRLPDGYQTRVQERGSNFSQGQRQLIAFARAVLADPRILILDEATSNVDTRTEMLIQRALDRLLRGRTSFVIAHRLSTIRNADQVLMIVDGRIVERGTHEELLARRGAYYEMYRKQFPDEEIPEVARPAAAVPALASDEPADGGRSAAGEAPDADEARLEIVVNGAETVDLEGIDVERLVVRVNGPGVARLSGRVDRLEVRVSGAGRCDGAGLDSRVAEVRVHGPGRAVVRAREEMDVLVSGGGNVAYYGDPRVTRRICGAGRVDRLDGAGEPKGMAETSPEGRSDPVRR
ncbi:MAG: ATP-binding cassette domain-containing protein [Chloroflexi bacterium]|nr:ATP-binding cassette domain-containing protein [Chloroflexota bacterium]